MKRKDSRYFVLFWCLCVFLLFAGCGQGDQSKAPNKQGQTKVPEQKKETQPEPSIDIGDTGVLMGKAIYTIDTKETISIQKAMRPENEVSRTEMQDLIVKLINIQAKLGDACTVSESMMALVALVQAEKAHDSEGKAQMVMDGLVFGVDNGTKVRVIDRQAGTCKVRIISGPLRGRAGYVMNEWVVR